MREKEAAQTKPDSSAALTLPKTKSSKTDTLCLRWRSPKKTQACTAPAGEIESAAVVPLIPEPLGVYRE